MALTSYISKDSNILADELAHNINNTRDVFAPHFIITAHASTKNWLTEHIALKNNISAHLFFQSTEEFVTMVYNILEGEVERKESLATETMLWLIHYILATKEFKAPPEHITVVSYIGDDEMKRFTLAEKITEMFEQYQTKEPEMLRKWNINENANLGADLAEAEIWQRYIWHHLKTLTHDKVLDITQRMDSIYSNLNKPEKVKVLVEKVPEVSFYGNLPYNMEYLKFLHALGEKTTIRIFVYRQDYFTQGTSEHRLVRNLGTYGTKQNELFLTTVVSSELPSTSKAQPLNLLQSLQELIKGSPIAYSRDIEKDDSLTINNCFSVYREVEVLYHYLIKQFSDNSMLGMRDICVVVADIEKYIPAVNAIFSNKDFPISANFYDTSHKIKSSPYMALESLLNLEQNNFTSRQVLGLLEFDFIRDQFGFREDIGLLTRAVSEANIRHGMDGNPELETNLVSWRYGLKRLIYGFSLPPKDELVTISDTPFFPVISFEEQDTIELLRLYEFVEELDRWLKNRRNPRNLAEWVKFVEEETMGMFLDMKDHETVIFSKLLNSWRQAYSMSEEAEIGFDVLRYHLSNVLNSMGSGSHKGYGGVRFVSANAYLAAPTTICVFLGINGKDFPRHSTRLSFDVSDSKHPTITDLDKNLFLQLILSSREKFYLSYIGQSVKDNSIIPPSTLVEELVASVIESLLPDKTASDLITKHPLHHFSVKYNRDRAKLYRYDSTASSKVLKLEDQATDLKSTAPKLETDGNGNLIVPLVELIKFIEDPIKFYYNKILGIYYYEKDELLSEVEAFELDNLEQWGLKDEILQKAIHNIPLADDLRLMKVMKGELPYKKFGERELLKATEEVQELINELGPLQGRVCSKLIIDLLLEHSNAAEPTFRLVGEIENLFEDTILFATPSSDKWKYRIRSIIQFLSAIMTKNKMHNADELKLRYISKDNSTTLSQTDLDPQFINDDLYKLCALFHQGQSKLIPFNSDFFKLKSEKLSLGMGYEKLTITILNLLESGGDYIFPSTYFMREFGNEFLIDDQVADEFIENYYSIIKLAELIPTTK